MSSTIPLIESSEATSLPLIELACSLFEDLSLEDICIIGAQHILPTTLKMFQSLFMRGLNPKNLLLVGKCYSTDLETYLRFVEMGVYVCTTSHKFNKNKAFDEVYKKNLDGFCNRALNFIKTQKFKKIIILDDGGYLIANFNSNAICDRLNIVGVEQTTAGYEKLRHLNLKFPVVNVARSKAKLKYESPIIAYTVKEQLYMKLKQQRLKDKKMLIVGNGAIGSSIFNDLHNEYDIETCDLLASRSSIDPKSLKRSLSKYDLIIGCTGRTILTPDDFKLLKRGVCLISASSSDREFSAHELRKKCSSALKCHDDFSVDGIQVLNCGFPVNFSDNPALTDPEIFQFTRSLLIAAIMTGLQKKLPKIGLVPLATSIQNRMIDAFLRRLPKKLTPLKAIK